MNLAMAICDKTAIFKLGHPTESRVINFACRFSDLAFSIANNQLRLFDTAFKTIWIHEKIRVKQNTNVLNEKHNGQNQKLSFINFNNNHLLTTFVLHCIFHLLKFPKTKPTLKNHFN